jgi:hypothetical protein
MLPDARHGETARSTLAAMNCAERVGRWPLGEVGAKLDARESNLNYLEIVGTWELLLSFPDGRSAAFECSKRNDDCRATCHAIAVGAAELIRNLPRPRSLDPDFTDWDPDDMDTWDERIRVGRRRRRLPRLAA